MKHVKNETTVQMIKGNLKLHEREEVEVLTYLHAYRVNSLFLMHVAP